MNVLIADDDSLSRKYLRALLLEEGHQVSECEDGSAALACIRHAAIDAVISDILMPGTDGY